MTRSCPSSATDTGDADVGGLSRAQFDVLRAYRGGWEWSPFMPKPEGSDTTPTISRCRVPKPVSVTAWDEPMWIVRVVYTPTEAEMISASVMLAEESIAMAHGEVVLTGEQRGDAHAPPSICRTFGFNSIQPTRLTRTKANGASTLSR